MSDYPEYGFYFLFDIPQTIGISNSIITHVHMNFKYELLFMLYYWGIHVKAVWSWLVGIDRGVVKHVPFRPHVDINLTQVRKGNIVPSCWPLQWLSNSYN